MRDRHVFHAVGRQLAQAPGRHRIFGPYLAHYPCRPSTIHSLYERVLRSQPQKHLSSVPVPSLIAGATPPATCRLAPCSPPRWPYIGKLPETTFHATNDASSSTDSIPCDHVVPNVERRYALAASIRPLALKAYFRIFARSPPWRCANLGRVRHGDEILMARAHFQRRATCHQKQELLFTRP